MAGTVVGKPASIARAFARQFWMPEQGIEIFVTDRLTGVLK
jgi:hypothetical protein